MKILLFVLLLLFLFSCTKADITTKQTCFKGRFIAEGCWTVVQLLEPIDESLPTAQYATQDEVYEHTFGTGSLPDKYKNGQPFYFTVNHIDSNIIYETYCLPTKYVASIDSISDVPCGQVEK